MLAFVSHSTKDQAIYSTLCLALDAAGIERWDQTTMSLDDRFHETGIDEPSIDGT